MSACALTFAAFQRHCDSGGASTDGEYRLALFDSLPVGVQADCWARLDEQIRSRRWQAGEVDFDYTAGGRKRLRRRSTRTTGSQVASLRFDRLLELPPPQYFGALAGIAVPDRGGMVSCPVHEDHTPSCKVYATSERGWYCFGCQRGGSVYDLAAGLSGIGTRGEEFKRLRSWIDERLTFGAHEVAA